MLARDPFTNAEPLIRRVYAYVAYRIGDGHDAEDVTSDTFVRAVRYRESYDAAKGSPTAWLIGIARRVIAEGAARNSNGSGEAYDRLLKVSEGVTDTFEERALLRLTVSDALTLLDGRDRDLVALRYGADLRAREIGAVLGLRTNTVEVGLHRALARLRAIMATRPASGPQDEHDVRITPTRAVLREEPFFDTLAKEEQKREIS